MAKSSNWNDELITKLTDLYNQGKYSTKQIGDILGLSKNAIVGKIHRLELNKNVEKTSSISTVAQPEPKKPSMVKPPLLTTKMTFDSTLLLSKKTTIAHKPKQYLLEEISLNMCVWPYGEDNFTFCGEKVIQGKPYCQEHFEKAYLKFNKRAIKK